MTAPKRPGSGGRDTIALTATTMPASNGSNGALLPTADLEQPGLAPPIKTELKAGVAAQVQAADGADGGAQTPKDPKQLEQAKRKQQDALLQKAGEVRARRALLSRAFERPTPEPERPLSHWDYVMKEMRWMAVDFAQERLWKRAAAYSIAHEIAGGHATRQLRQTPQGDLMRKEIAEAQARAAEDASTQERLQSGRSAGTSASAKEDGIFDGLDLDGDLAPRTPSRLSDMVYTYAGEDELSGLLHAHLAELEEARVIAHDMEIREYDIEYEAARRAAMEVKEAAAAEAQRVRDLEERDAMSQGLDDDGDDLGTKKGRRKKARVPLHYADYEDLDADDGSLLGKAKQPKSSRPVSAGEARWESEDAGTGLRVSRERKKRKFRDYDDDEDEVPMSIRREKLTRKGSDLGRKPLDRSKKLKNGQKAPGSGSQLGRVRSTSAGGMAGQPIAWTPQDDQLLCAIVHEFGANWVLVSDVLSSSSAMQGIHRRPDACRYRFKAITQEGGAQEGQEESALAGHHITKGQARELLQKSIPVTDSVLQRHLDVLLGVGLAAKQKRAQNEALAKEAQQRRQDPHPSHQQPASAQASPQAPAASAAAPAPPGLPGGLTPGPGTASPMLGAAAANANSMAGAAANTRQAAAMPGQASPALGIPGAGGAASPALPHPHALPPQAAGALPAGAGGPVAGQQQRTTSVTLPQVQQMLKTGLMPNGQPLTQKMHAHLTAQVTAAQQRHAAQQAQQAQSKGLQAVGAMQQPNAAQQALSQQQRLQQIPGAQAQAMPLGAPMGAPGLRAAGMYGMAPGPPNATRLPPGSGPLPPAMANASLAGAVPGSMSPQVPPSMGLQGLAGQVTAMPPPGMQPAMTNQLSTGSGGVPPPGAS
ncbi:hypothetical protein WJX72_011693 [[Myrmecia] bisecta]|uniref:Uncharacterized protein n=1 Tax=[Myrmecia] bisecta TaxID=41462 RepID=A0AAW1QSY7_9CHLO